MTINKLVIIQARMTSSRLPGKVLMEIAGQPMLQRVVDRASHAKSIDGMLVATTTDPTDDILEQYCNEHGISCFRGSLADVLDRYYQAALQFQADVIIRLTADCPLIDPTLIDLTVTTFLDGFSITANHSKRPTSLFDFAANRLPPPWKRTIPIGLDVEVCSFDALQRAWKEADQAFQREHVMPYMYDGVTFTQSSHPIDTEWYVEQSISPHNFRVAYLNHYPGYGSLRWTVDTASDLEFIRQVYARLPGNSVFGWQHVRALLEKEPELARINASIKHKTAYDVDEHMTNI